MHISTSFGDQFHFLRSIIHHDG